MQILGPSLGADIVADARAAEALGFSGVRVLDHLYCQIGSGPINTFDHPLVALGAAAAATERVLLTQTVLDVSRRHPTEVAQAIATLDRISGGRAELGIGAGWYEPEHESIGFDLGTPGTRVERLLEGLAICRAMFDDNGRVDFDGNHFVAHVEQEWAPTHRKIPIVVGASRPRLIREAAQYADRLEILAPGPLYGKGGTALTHEIIAGYLDTARGVATEHGRTIEFSARVTAGADTEADPQDPLSLGGGSDRMLAGVQTLADMGFSRLTVLPVDAGGNAWLEENIGSLCALGAGIPAT